MNATLFSGDAIVEELPVDRVCNEVRREISNFFYALLCKLVIPIAFLILPRDSYVTRAVLTNIGLNDQARNNAKLSQSGVDPRHICLTDLSSSFGGRWSSIYCQ